MIRLHNLAGEEELCGRATATKGRSQIKEGEILTYYPCHSNRLSVVYRARLAL
jgi:hypothetical protein